MEYRLFYSKEVIWGTEPTVTIKSWISTFNRWLSEELDLRNELSVYRTCFNASRRGVSFGQHLSRAAACRRWCSHYRNKILSVILQQFLTFWVERSSPGEEGPGLQQKHAKCLKLIFLYSSIKQVCDSYLGY